MLPIPIPFALFWRISRSLEKFVREELPAHISPHRVLEFGPGRSTRALAETFPSAEIVSLEHQEIFYLKQQELLRDLPNVWLYHQPLDENLFYSAGVWQNMRYDLIFVDGPPKKIKPGVRGGAACVFDQLTDGGFVILDDSHRPDERAIIRRWLAGGEFEVFHAAATFTVLRKVAAKVEIPEKRQTTPRHALEASCA